jgi:hypothetical protein
MARDGRYEMRAQGNPQGDVIQLCHVRIEDSD